MTTQAPRTTLSMRLALALGLALPALTGCASIDFEYPKPHSTAYTDTAETTLGQHAASLPPQGPGEASFFPLEQGVDALSMRLLMAQRAERSIDAQYYLITADITGFLFLRELINAADRGVRVRLLLDDVQTVGYDAGMRALDAHPNIELRIFNPWVQRRWRTLSVLAGDFKRVNRRMHNKSFTVDNQFTVIGGRNIAAEYFDADSSVHFGDLDLLGIGNVARDVSTMFDLYWNDRLAVPVPAFEGEAEHPEEELSALRERIETALINEESSPYGKVLETSIRKLLAKGEANLVRAPYRLVYDPPAKAERVRPDDLETIVTPLRASIEAARSELLVVSPYFVPRRKGVAGFKELRERGIKTTVVTNSLAANNHSVVHAGYMSSRKPLLRMGVELYEVRPDAVGRGPNEEPDPTVRATLHTKAFIVDRRTLFIGSFNWDPRSALINTEMGIFLESPELAEQFSVAAYESLPLKSYRLFLSEGGRLRWAAQEDGEEVVLKNEPLTSVGKRLLVAFMRLLPIRGQL